MRRAREGDVVYEAIAVLQRFVCALEDGHLLRPSLSDSLPAVESDRDRLLLNGVLFELAQRLDRKGEVAALARRVGLTRAVESLARDRLRERLQPDLSRFFGESVLRYAAEDRGLSPEALRRRVRKAVGVAPRTLRRQQRICLAIDYIRDGMKVSAAARECGYKSESSFFVAFRQATGLPPAGVRALSDAEVKALKERLMPWAIDRERTG